MREGRFREDLYYRLKVVQLDLPPLRDREGDVGLLVEFFLSMEATEQGRLARSVTPESLEKMEAYSWPGNIRQLRNEIRRLTLLGEDAIHPKELSPEILDTGPPVGEELSSADAW